MPYISAREMEFWRTDIPRFEEDPDKMYNDWLAVNSRLLKALDRIEELEELVDVLLGIHGTKLYNLNIVK